MALTQVQRPDRSGSGPLGKVGKIAQIAGAATTFVNPALGGLISAGGTIASGLDQPQSQTPSPQPTESSTDIQSAVARRAGAENPQQDIIDATIAIEQSGLPQEAQTRLKVPLMLARQRGGF